MKNLSGWAIALIVIGVLLLAGLTYRFLLANKAVNVLADATKTATISGGTKVDVPEKPVDVRTQQLTQAQRLRRV